ncbi:hypothetical protein [Streptomyces cinereoruber]
MAVQSKPVKPTAAVSPGTTVSGAGPDVPCGAVDGRSTGKESQPA